MKRLTLVDLDSIVYIIAYQNKDNDNTLVVQDAVHSFIKEIIDKTEAESYAGYYQKKGHRNFRNIIFPKYKANRPPTPEYITKWRPTIHEVFDSYPGFTGLEIIESDDALSIMSNEYKDKYLIMLSHIDKDINNIQGEHHKYTSHDFYTVKYEEAKYNFCNQVLAGDSSDGIPGVPGIGPAKAKKFLVDNTTLIKAYKNAAKSKKVNTWIRNFYRDYHCIRLLQNIDELSKFTDVEEVDIFKIDEFDYDEHEDGADQDNMYALDF